MAEVRRIDDVAELRRLGKLRDVVYFGLHGRRGDAFKTAPDLEEGTNVMQLTEGSRLSTRFRTVLRAPDAVREFAGTVAFPIAHPFIREALRDLASRPGVKRPLLQLLPPEGIELEDRASRES